MCESEVEGSELAMTTVEGKLYRLTINFKHGLPPWISTKRFATHLEAASEVAEVIAGLAADELWIISDYSLEEEGDASGD